jgi:hypothetical protein
MESLYLDVIPDYFEKWEDPTADAADFNEIKRRVARALDFSGVTKQKLSEGIVCGDDLDPSR